MNYGLKRSLQQVDRNQRKIIHLNELEVIVLRKQNLEHQNRQLLKHTKQLSYSLMRQGILYDQGLEFTTEMLVL